MANPVKIGKSIKGGLERYKQTQDPKVAKALEDYLSGKISSAERIGVVRDRLPIRPITEMPPAYTNEQIMNALRSDKRPKAFAPVEPGTIVGNRLDIPAYTEHGVYVDTTHLGGKGSPLSYGRTGHLKDVTFESDPNFFARVGLGTPEQGLTQMSKEMGKAKGPSAVIKGRHQGTEDEEIRRAMAEIMGDPNWTQVGMNPYRHSQFYDKSDMAPVWSAEEKLQIGPLIMVPKRGLEKTDWEDPRLSMRNFEGKKYNEGGLAQYAKGGKTAAWQRKEGKNPEGGLNAKGRASYHAETGGTLKRPQPEGGARRDSFCARMSGMKKKLTSSKTANDPDSRINKALRKWNC